MMLADSPRTYGWTPHRDAMLARLVGAGHSWSTIGRLCGRTKKSRASPLESPPERRRRACPEEAEKSQDPMDTEDGCPACLSETGWSPHGLR